VCELEEDSGFGYFHYALGRQRTLPCVRIPGVSEMLLGRFRPVGPYTNTDLPGGIRAWKGLESISEEVTQPRAD